MDAAPLDFDLCGGAGGAGGEGESVAAATGDVDAAAEESATAASERGGVVPPDAFLAGVAWPLFSLFQKNDDWRSLIGAGRRVPSE